jgi:hypothetical protein
MCGGQIMAAQKKRVWIGVLVQITIAFIFMSVFKFPRVMFAGFAVFVLIVTALTAWGLKSRQSVTRPALRTSSSHPIAFRVLSVLIAIGALVVVSCLLFGFVAFANNWELSQKYKDQPYHRSDFIVTRTYFQRTGKGGLDLYASGTVDGNKEWMNLQPFLGNVRPHDEGELNDLVPEGTSIPIYLFPGMKGHMRIRVYSETPSAEGYYRAAMSAVKTSLSILAVTIVVLFFLVRFRQAISDEIAPAAQAVASPR